VRKEWKNCYAQLDEDVLIVGNNLIERKFECKDNILRGIWLWDKKNDKMWRNEREQEEEGSCFSDFPYEKSKCEISFFPCPEDELS